ncbi:MAG TPA: NfeD family protein [Candidatus Binataceae bacterium]|nr:NfeD family protein [Candidatus Binataceae bacterium]
MRHAREASAREAAAQVISMPWWLWGIVGIALIALETHTTRNFTLFCVGASALVVGAMTGLTNTQPWVQWLAFVVLSTGTLLWARDWLATMLLARGDDEREFANVVGQIAVPIDDLPALGFGKAEMRGTTWSVHNATKTVIPRGQRCRVSDVRDLTLWVSPE